MKLHKRIFLAVIAVVVMAAPLYAQHILRGSAARSHSLSDFHPNPPKITASDTLPVSYDLRDYGRVPPIRDQSPWGTCWAFGAMSAVESNYLTRKAKGEITADLGDAQTVDFSELHEAWFIKNNPLKDRAIKPVYGDVDVANIEGGFPAMSLAYFARLDGPVLETELPYLSYEVISNDLGFVPGLWKYFKDNDLLPSYKTLYYLGRFHASRDVIPAPDSFAQTYGLPMLRLTDALYGAFSPFVGYKERSEVAENDQYRQYIDIDSVKRLIMEHGAVEIAYEHRFDFIDTVHNSYYLAGSSTQTINHAVAIIGWDDNYPRTAFSGDKKPDIDGAWLVRNNWGEYSGSDKGYFWMSYCQAIVEGVAFIVEDMPSMFDLTYYEHDLLGTCDYMGVEGQKTFWAANTFKAETDGQSLESISFYTTENNAVCEWQIFYDLPNKPVTGPYVAGAVSVSGSQSFPYAGYHTVKLDSPIPLTGGHFFTVVVKFTNSYGDYPVAVETKLKGYSDFAVVHDYESWFSADGVTWTDGTAQLVFLDNDYSHVVHLPMNACIKAFCRYTSTPSFYAPDSESIMGISLGDFPAGVQSVSALASSLAENGFRQGSMISYLNSSIPDEPLSARAVAIVPNNWQTLLDPSADKTPEDITFMLVNRTQEREFTQVYKVSEDTRYPTGLFSPREVEYQLLFEPGYEPDVFWRTTDLFEFPVYGPFKAQAAEAIVSLDVNNLVYADGSSKTQGAIPKGYYDVIFMVPMSNDVARESIAIRLASTNLQTEPDTPSDTPVATVGSSGGSCDSGAGFAGLAAVFFLTKAARKRR